MARLMENASDMAGRTESPPASSPSRRCRCEITYRSRRNLAHRQPRRRLRKCIPSSLGQGCSADACRLFDRGSPHTWKPVGTWTSLHALPERVLQTGGLGHGRGHHDPVRLLRRWGAGRIIESDHGLRHVPVRHDRARSRSGAPATAQTSAQVYPLLPRTRVLCRRLQTALRQGRRERPASRAGCMFDTPRIRTTCKS